MKHLLIVAALLAATSAHATNCSNGAKDWPKCTPPSTSALPTVTTRSSANATAAAGAKAQAVGVGLATGGDASATGGTGGAGGNQSQEQSAGGGSSSLTDSSSSSSKALALFLPPPVFTPPLPPTQCPSANTEQSAVAVGVGLFSHAQGSTNTDNCTAIIIYNQYVATCKYASAQQVLNLLSVKVLPGFKTSAIALEDFTHEQCKVLLAPPPAPPPVVNYITHVMPPAVVPPPAKPAPKKSAPKKRAAPPKPCNCVIRKTS